MLYTGFTLLNIKDEAFKKNLKKSQLKKNEVRIKAFIERPAHQ